MTAMSCLRHDTCTYVTWLIHVHHKKLAHSSFWLLAHVHSVSQKRISSSHGGYRWSLLETAREALTIVAWGGLKAWESWPEVAKTERNRCGSNCNLWAFGVGVRTAAICALCHFALCARTTTVHPAAVSRFFVFSFIFSRSGPSINVIYVEPVVFLPTSSTLLTWPSTHATAHASLKQLSTQACLAHTAQHASMPRSHENTTHAATHTHTTHHAPRTTHHIYGYLNSDTWPRPYHSRTNWVLVHQRHNGTRNTEWHTQRIARITPQTAHITHDTANSTYHTWHIGILDPRPYHIIRLLIESRHTWHRVKPHTTHHTPHTRLMDTWTSPISFTCQSSHGTHNTESHQTQHITQHSKHMSIRQPRPFHLPANQVNRVTAHVTQSHSTQHRAQSTHMDAWTSPTSFTCQSSHGTCNIKSHQTEHSTQHAGHSTQMDTWPFAILFNC